MKKLLTFALVLCLALSMFVVASAEGEKTAINVYRCTFNLAQSDEAQVKKVEDAINEYIADKINVEIHLTDIGSGEYTEKANLALANNEINLLWTASWEGTIGTNDLVPMNAVYDITDLLPGTALYESMDEGQWEATKYDGKNYFVPVYKDNVEGYDFMFRKDLVDEYGWDITSVKSLADLEPMLADAAAAGLKYPFLTQKTAMFYRWYIDKFDFFTANSATNFFAVDRETNEVVDTILTPEYAELHHHPDSGLGHLLVDRHPRERRGQQPLQPGGCHAARHRALRAQHLRSGQLLLRHRQQHRSRGEGLHRLPGPAVHRQQAGRPLHLRHRGRGLRVHPG